MRATSFWITASFQDDFEIIEVLVHREEGLVGEYDESIEYMPPSSDLDHHDDTGRRGEVVKKIRLRTSHLLGFIGIILAGIPLF
jgi:hypothetical protein